jgi:enolase
MDVQELMLVPKRKTVAERIRVGAEVFHALGKILKAGGHSVAVGDEGGFAPKLGRPEDALACMAEAVDAAGYRLGKDVCFAADVASSEFYDAKKKRYVLRAEKVELTSEALLERYAGWIETYPFESIEDPFAEDDWSAWTEALPVFEGAEVRVVGDDLLVTNVERLSRAIEEQAANTILIKLNQIGSVSETVATIQMCQAAGWTAVASHRSGETEDAFIADLAVGLRTGQIKTGSLSRTDRVAKYNQLLRIEEELGSKAKYVSPFKK